LQPSEIKTDLADILAVLAMTMGKDGSRESLKFKLLGNSTDLGSWGHDFVRSLAGEVGEEYNARITFQVDTSPDVSDLLAIVDAIVPFHMKHNAEPEAIDILIEVQQLSKLLDSKEIDEKNFQRVCLYLLACADYMSDPDDLSNVVNTSFCIYLRLQQYTDALRVALRLGNEKLVAEVFETCRNPVTKRQMGYILGRQRFCFEEESDLAVNDMINNTELSDKFLTLARDLDVMEAKTPEDIYKSHLSETGSTARTRDGGSQTVDSASHNLASTFVNALVNVGYGTDKLITPEGNTWIYKNKKQGMMSAAASLGMIMLWNVEEGITQIDKYLYSGDEYVKAGAILGVGVVSAGVRNECDPPLALLSEHIDSDISCIRRASCLGLGMAYAGSAREDVSELLLPVVSNSDESMDMEENAYAALALGMVNVGTCEEEAASALMQRLMESTNAELDSPFARFLALGLGLLYLGYVISVLI
jgi:26S proteasome regulatory subunit N1